MQRVRAWDLAATEDASADWTVGLLMGLTKSGVFYIEDVVRGRWTPRARDEVILNTARLDGKKVSIWLEEEPGSAGKSQSMALMRMLTGFTVHVERMTGDKVTRAGPVAAQLEAGNVRLVNGPWCQRFIDECLQFPNGAHDDQVDACSLAFNQLAGDLPKWWQDGDLKAWMKARASGEPEAKAEAKPAGMLGMIQPKKEEA